MGLLYDFFFPVSDRRQRKREPYQLQGRTILLLIWFLFRARAKATEGQFILMPVGCYANLCWRTESVWRLLVSEVLQHSRRFCVCSCPVQAGSLCKASEKNHLGCPFSFVTFLLQSGCKQYSEINQYGWLVICLPRKDKSLLEEKTSSNNALL